MRTMQTAATDTRPQSEKSLADSRSSEVSLGPETRLMSLDFFRGFTMFLLIAESTDIYDLLVAPELNGTLVSTIGTAVPSSSLERA